jgi:hypothetical protein
MTLHKGSLWVALSLELGLAAQADTEIEAKQALIAQIDDYIEEANGDDYWLNRKAPFESYVLYYWLAFKNLWIKDHSPIFSQSTNAHA